MISKEADETHGKSTSFYTVRSIMKVNVDIYPNHSVRSVKNPNLFKDPVCVTADVEKRMYPFIIQETAAEVERRGCSEVGIYRVNGAACEIKKLRQLFENSPRQAKQQLKVNKR